MKVNSPKSSESLPAEAYARLFVNTPEGAAMLEELVRRFCRGPVLEGGIDGIRKSDYRAGQNSVPQFILRQINIAAGVPEPSED